MGVSCLSESTTKKGEVTVSKFAKGDRVRHKISKQEMIVLRSNVQLGTEIYLCDPGTGGQTVSYAEESLELIDTDNPTLLDRVAKLEERVKTLESVKVVGI